MEAAARRWWRQTAANKGLGFSGMGMFYKVQRLADLQNKRVGIKNEN